MKFQKQRLRYYYWLGKSDNWSNLQDRGMGNIRHLDIDNRIENKNKNKLHANNGHLISFLVLNLAFGRHISLSLHLCSSFLPFFTFSSSSAQYCSLSVFVFALSRVEHQKEIHPPPSARCQVSLQLFSMVYVEKSVSVEVAFGGLVLCGCKKRYFVLI